MAAVPAHSVTVNWLIEADLAFVARANLRQLRVGGHTLGRGAGLDLNLDQTVTREGHGPRVIVGYRGAFATFSPDASAPPDLATPLADPALGLAARQALVSNLVSRRLNRHGAGLVITDNLAHAWRYRFTAGTDYDFELSSAGWNTALALSFFPRKSVEFTSELGYTSSATSSNAGSAAALLSFFIRSYY